MKIINDAISSHIGRKIRDTIDNEMPKHLPSFRWNPIYNQVIDEIATPINEQVDDQLYAQIRDNVWKS